MLALSFGYKVGVVRAIVQTPRRAIGLGDILGRGLLVSVMAGIAACSMIGPASKERVGHLTAELNLSGGLEARVLPYQDACGTRREVPIGPAVRDAFEEQATRVFARLARDGSVAPSLRPDRRLAIGLETGELVLFAAGGASRSYPATVTLVVTVAAYDASRRLLERHRLRVAAEGTVYTEAAGCVVHGIEGVAREAIETLAQDFGAYLRTSEPVATGVVSPRAVGEAPVALSFRARLSDEDGDHVLEEGEQVTLEVEVTNIGHDRAEGVHAVVSGRVELLRHLPQRIPFGDLAPGESKRESVSARLGAVDEAGQIELVLTVESRTVLARAPARKKFLVTVRPKHRAHPLLRPAERLASAEAGPPRRVRRTGDTLTSQNPPG